MNARDLEHFKKTTLEKRREVLRHRDVLESIAAENSDRSVNAEDKKYASHLADLASDTIRMEQDTFFMARSSKYLQYLDEALGRIETGEYGICLKCGEEIPKERLEVVPHTRYCVPCKSKV